MALTLETLVRVFKYNGMELADPGPGMNPDAVKEFYANIYPELNNAAIEGPEHKGAKAAYEFRRAVGTKGATLRERLVAQLAGDDGKPRGNAVSLDQIERTKPFAAACVRLTVRRYRGDYNVERVAAPSELLQPLP